MKLQDPAPSERVYYRHAQTGDRAYLVMRDGKQCIRYDQPEQERVLIFRAHDWIPENDGRTYTVAQVATVAHAADRELCRMLGMFQPAKVSWYELPEAKRLSFLRDGPPGPEIRKKLFRAVMASLSEVAK